ncbi:MAG: MerR family transcriptional regulator [Ilumatobacteraceae bacterium]|nr:MerR family transcriptional regulator [Ilumatobacteraceae bacterium]
MDELTIDQLATTSGVPTRTIRQYQTEGVLAPPTRRGRIGYYGAEHQQRLALIARLQARGYSLAGMRDLFDAADAGSSLHDVLGIDVDLTPVDEPSVLCTEAQLVEQLPALERVTARRAATRAGLIERVAGSDGWRVRSPAALEMIGDLVSAGASANEAIAMYQRLRIAFEAMATDLARLAHQLPDDEVVALLRRSRGALTRSVATLAVGAVGESLTTDLRAAVRIGAVTDRRT